MEYLVSKGYRWQDDIHRTYSKHHKYYATESEKLKRDLDFLRNSKITMQKGESIINSSPESIKFIDTNILLSHLGDLKNEDNFLLSSVTLTELEDIKSSKNKTEDLRYNARQAVHFLEKNPSKYNIVVYDSKIASDFSKYGLEDTPDNRIIKCAEYARNILGYKSLVFVSDDILARLIAENYFHLPSQPFIGKDDTDELYRGYIVKVLNDEELASFYENMI